MALSAEYSFRAAIPVWEKGMENEMNISLAAKAVVEGGAPCAIHIAAHTRYQLFVNGAFVAAGPARAAHGYFRADEFDLTSRMTERENVVAVIVAGYNINSFYLTRQPSFLCAEIVSGDEVLFATGTDKPFRVIRWLPRVQRTQRYSYQRPFTEAYECHATYDFFITLPGENYPDVPLERMPDKRFIVRGVPYGDFEEVKAQAITSRGICVPARESREFHDRCYTEIGEHILGYPKERLYVDLTRETLAYTTQILEPDPTEPECVSLGVNCCAIYDMGRDTTGYIRLSLTAQHDTVVYAVFNQKLTKDGLIDPIEDSCVNVVSWSLQGGRAYDLVSFEPYTYRYIQIISMYAPTLISNVSQYRESMSKSQLVNLKKMPDAELQKIYDAAVETFVQNSTDIFMDCPSRERAGWLCDAWFTSAVEKELTGKNAVDCNFLENFIMADGFEDLPDGMLPMCYPSDHYDGAYIPNWAMWYVLQLRDHTRRNGDDLYLDAKDRVYGLADFLAGYENSDGLLEKLDSWVFVEWSKANDFVQDVNYPTNMLYYRFLTYIAELYGDDAMAAKAERVKRAVLSQSFDGSFFRDNAIRVGQDLAVQENRTETCQYYAFFMGVATPESHPGLWKTMLEDFGSVRDVVDKYPDVYRSNAFIGNYLRISLMLEAGQREKLLEDIRKFFLPMAEKTGTLWENMSDFASTNHGFASYVALALNRIVG